MTTQEIMLKLISLKVNTSDNYQCFRVGNNLYGKNSDNNLVFIMSSRNYGLTRIQQTKYLTLINNLNCIIQVGEQLQEGRFDIITCLSDDPKYVKVFVELTNLNANNDQENLMTNYFICLKDLFANKQKLPLKELQGLYAELYVMHYMKQNGIDLYSLWQSVDKMKFDFSISDTKKIEVKSTISENRIHKFRHEQLVTDIYDVWIISILLRKDDKGLSLYQLANIVKEECEYNINVFAHVENLLLNFSDEDLKNIKFNTTYINDHLAFYKAVDVPRFKTQQPSGVSNTEYDSDLNNINSRSIDDFIIWLNN